MCKITSRLTISYTRKKLLADAPNFPCELER